MERISLFTTGWKSWMQPVKTVCMQPPGCSTHCITQFRKVLLEPNTDYTWRVRVSDSDNWEYVENRTNSELATFTVADTLVHTNKPAIFPNDWLAATYTYDTSPRVLLWLRVLDHDGVASDGSSHEVIGDFAGWG